MLRIGDQQAMPLEYPHAEGNCSITGGDVYRGNHLPLAGRYLHGDWCTERIWVATEQGGAWFSEEWPGVAATLSSLSSFGQDGNCELYLVDRQAGALHRIDDSERLVGAGFECRSCR